VGLSKKRKASLGSLPISWREVNLTDASIKCVGYLKQQGKYTTQTFAEMSK